MLAKLVFLFVSLRALRIPVHAPHDPAVQTNADHHHGPQHAELHPRVSPESAIEADGHHEGGEEGDGATHNEVKAILKPRHPFERMVGVVVTVVLKARPPQTTMAMPNNRVMFPLS